MQTKEYSLTEQDTLKKGAQALQTSSACRFYDLVIIKLKNFTAVRSDLRFYK
jgi:hypothetical protein